MSHTALQSVTDAIDATREFLFDPFSVKRWLVTAFVVLFVGGVGGFNPFSFANSASTGSEDQLLAPGQDPLEAARESLQSQPLEVATILGIALLVVLVMLALRLVAAIMEFVFVESLRTDEVRVVGYFSSFKGEGLRLFGFRLVMSAITWGAFLAGAYVALRQFWGPLDLGFWSLVAIAIGVLAVVFAVALVARLTTSFVVPVMLVADTGVIGGWRRFYPVLRSSWTEYLLYLVIHWILGVAVGTVVGFFLLFVGFIVIIPFIFVVLFAIAVGDAVGVAVVVVFSLLAVLFFWAIAAVVNVPFVSYLRYYDLLVLGDTASDLDPIPDLRERIRESQDDLGGGSDEFGGGGGGDVGGEDDTGDGSDDFGGGGGGDVGGEDDTGDGSDDFGGGEGGDGSGRGDVGDGSDDIGGGGGADVGGRGDVGDGGDDVGDDGDHSGSGSVDDR